MKYSDYREYDAATYRRIMALKREAARHRADLKRLRAAGLDYASERESLARVTDELCELKGIGT